MGFHRSFPTKHSHDGINTLRRKQRTASHGSCVVRALSRFRFFAVSVFIKATGRSKRDEDGIDWGSEEVREFIRPRDEDGIEWGSEEVGACIRPGDEEEGGAVGGGEEGGEKKKRGRGEE